MAKTAAATKTATKTVTLPVVTRQAIFGLGSKALGDGRGADFVEKPSAVTAAPIVFHLAQSLADLAAVDIAKIMGQFALYSRPEAAPVTAKAAKPAKVAEETAPAVVDRSDEYAVFPVGTVCEAKWPEDGVFYSALITGHLKNGMVKIVHADTGNTEYKRSLDDVKSLKGKRLAAATVELTEAGLLEVEAPAKPTAPVSTHGFHKTDKVRVILPKVKGKKQETKSGTIVAVGPTEAKVKFDDGSEPAIFPVASLRGLMVAGE